MKFLEIAQTRYTTKEYDSNKKISINDIQDLKEILRLSPSSINSQPWKFIIISDDKLKSELAEASLFNQKKIEQASHLVVFNTIDNISLFENQIKEELPEGHVEYYNAMIKPKGEEYTKIWMANQVYLSLGYFMSACASMGIDSTAMEGIEPEKYKEILGLIDYKPLFAVAIGYRSSEDRNQPSITPKTRIASEKIIESK